MKKIVCAVLLVAACGGKSKPADTVPVEDNSTPHEQAQDQGGDMIPPEKMDEVANDLKRKAMIISRCLADAMETKDVPRGAHGKVTLELVIGTAGHADSVKVVKSDFRNAPKVDDCVVKHVQEIEFPQMPKTYETSYTYPMEAN